MPNSKTVGKRKRVIKGLHVSKSLKKGWEGTYPNTTPQHYYIFGRISGKPKCWPVAIKVDWNQLLFVRKHQLYTEYQNQNTSPYNIHYLFNPNREQVTEVNECRLYTGSTIAQWGVPILVYLNFSSLTWVGQGGIPHCFCLKALELQRLSNHSWQGALAFAKKKDLIVLQKGGQCREEK